eukprot:c18469_g1_i1 orf=182-1018(+)
MNSQGHTTTTTTHDPVCARGFSEEATRPLHDCACFLISLTRTLLERMTHLPFPIGTVVKCTEAMVDRCAHSLIQSLECHGLCILAAIDDKILAMVAFAEGCAFCKVTGVKRVLSLLRTQALIETSAGLWLRYEKIVKKDIQKALCLANKLPLVHRLTPVICAVSSPLAVAISDWLLKQVERIEKGSQTVESMLVTQKQNVEIQCLNNELDTPSCAVAGQAIKLLDVVDEPLEGKDVSMQYANKDDVLFEGGNTSMGVVKEDVHLARKDVNVDDALVGG